MPVDTRTQAYMDHEESWRRMRDSLAGEIKIKNPSNARDQIYLPPLDPTTVGTRAYDNYKLRAKWYGAPRATRSIFTGLVSRKAPDANVDRDPRMQRLLQDCTLTGVPLDRFAIDVLTELLSTGRVGVSVDVDMSGEPFIRIHKTESMINWRLARNGGLEMLVTETLDLVQDTTDEFLASAEAVYRVWSMERGPSGEPLGVVYRIWRSASNGILVPEPPVILRTARGSGSGTSGARLMTMPIVVGNSVGESPEPETALLEPIASLTHHMYRLSADLNWGLHFTALPTPWVTGVSKDNAPTTIGSTTLWCIPNSEARVGMLEFTGAGLHLLAEEIATTKSEIADMGARLLESRSKSAEAAATLEMKSSTDSASLSSIAAIASNVVEKALKIAHEWLGLKSDDVYFKLNQDFVALKIDAALMKSMLDAYTSGVLSERELFDQMRQGEIIAQDKTWEDHLAETEEDAVRKGASAAPGMDPGQADAAATDLKPDIAQ